MGSLRRAGKKCGARIRRLFGMAKLSKTDVAARPALLARDASPYYADRRPPRSPPLPAIEAFVTSTQSIRVAVVQAAPVAFDRESTLAKTRALALDASRRGAQLVVFPEAFVSAYPRGMTFGAVIGERTREGREWYRRYWESSVDVPGEAVDALGSVARECGAHLVIGVVERDGGTLYCTALFFAPN